MRSLGRLLLFVSAAAVCNPRFRAAVPSIASGDGHYLALTEAGVLYSWGRNDFGQLGLGGKPPAAWGGPTSPAVIPPPGGSTWAMIGAGDNHSLAISSDGSLWGWGRNDITQLAFRTSLTRRWITGGMRETSAVRISADKTWVAVSGGMLCSFALKRDGSLWAWGGNWMGQLGNESQTFMEFGAPIEKLPQMGGLNRVGKDADWVGLNAGSEHVLAQKRDGTLWAWGRNDCGQLGVGTYISTSRPVRINAETNWVMFSAAGAGQRGAWSAAIKQDGTLWVWGNWKRLKLPKSGVTPYDPNIVSRPLQFGTETNWVTIACGNETGAAIQTDGTLWTWGSSENASLPRQVGTDRDWNQVSVDGPGLGGEGTMHALKKDGTVWTWNPQIVAAPGTPPASGSVANGAPHLILRLGESPKAR